MQNKIILIAMSLFIVSSSYTSDAKTLTSDQEYYNKHITTNKEGSLTISEELLEQLVRAKNIVDRRTQNNTKFRSNRK